MKTLSGALALTAVLTAASTAHANGWAAEAAAAHVDNRYGAELGVGYSLTAGNFSLTPIVGGFVRGGDHNSRYQTQTVSGGSTICRDTSNGHFSQKENCEDGLAVDFYGRAEVAYRLSWGTIGAGARFGNDKTTGYGELSYKLNERSDVRVGAGSDYWTLGIAAHF